MPVPFGALLFIQANNPGVDGNRIVTNLIEEYGAGGAGVTLNAYSYNRFLITITMGWTFTTGSNTENNADWATAAAAINAIAGSIVAAQGAAGDTTVATGPFAQGLSAGWASAGSGQYYSPGGILIRVRKRFPQFIKNRYRGEG